MLFWLGGLLYRWRKGLLPLAIVLIALVTWYGVQVFNAVHSMGMEDPNSESARATELLADRFPRQTADIMLLLSNAAYQATDIEFMEPAADLISTLEDHPEVDSVSSYYATGTDALLSRDQHETLLIITLIKNDNKTGEEQFRELEPLFDAPPLNIDVGGTLITDIQFNEQLHADLLQAEMIGLPIVAVLLVIIFGGLVAAALPLLTGGVVIVGAFAIVRILANLTEVSSFATNVITIIGLGLAIDYSLFIVTRFREELAYDESNVQLALQRTMATAGRTVLFSGLTVGVSLVALLVFPQVMLRSIGMAIIAVALIAMLASLTVLPILLALLGRHVNALSLLRLFKRKSAPRTIQEGFWYRLAQWVMRRAFLVTCVIVVFLLLLGYPFLHANFAMPDFRTLPIGTSSRDVAERIHNNFPGQNSTQISVLLQMDGDVLEDENLERLDTYVRDLQDLDHVDSVQSLVSLNDQLTLEQYQQIYSNPGLNPQLDEAANQLADDDLTRIVVETDVETQSAEAKALVENIRALSVPANNEVLVGGETAAEVDQFNSLATTIPYALALMISAILVLLFLMTGSIIIPLKAVVLNVLSLSATFGMLVWIFQDGHFQEILAFEAVGSLDAAQPVLIFAIAFGLSMDYEVFLLSRIKEIYDHTGDNRESVAQGLQRTGGLITSAALLLAVVIGTFAISRIVYIKELGLGVASAIIMDATLVRGLLVPAMMRLMGKWNWWAPGPLQALWRLIGLSETSLPAPEKSSEEEKTPAETHA